MSKGYLIGFSLLLFTIGLILISITTNALNNLNSKCVSSNVLAGLNLILSIGIMLIVLPIVQLICYGKCGCSHSDLGYSNILIFLFITLTFLGIIVLAGINDSNCDDPTTKNSMIAITILGGLITGGLIFLKIRNK